MIFLRKMYRYLLLVCLKIGGISRDGHGIKLAYYLPAHKGDQGAKSLKLKALQPLEIERMGQICFNQMSIKAMLLRLPSLV